MEIDNTLDEEVKTALIRDVVQLVNPVPFNRQALAAVLERRLQEYTRPQRGSLHKGMSRKAEQQLLARDLHEILEGRVPRLYGEEPQFMDRFERVAPSANYTKYCKLKRM
uniref:Uncharacterized protein n=1 Tax=Eutreptiella gymnastica TaxID=73025 RepID=A0A7S4CEW4_9EUGL